MRSILSISEIVRPIELNGRACEVCGEAEAKFSDESSTLKVQLDCFTREVGVTAKEHHEHPHWLPNKQVQVEKVSHGEAGDLSREIFHSWITRLRSAIERQEETMSRSSSQK